MHCGEKMIELTKDRLDEARFFLSKLKEEKTKQVQQARPAERAGRRRRVNGGEFCSEAAHP